MFCRTTAFSMVDTDAAEGGKIGNCDRSVVFVPTTGGDATGGRYADGGIIGVISGSGPTGGAGSDAGTGALERV